MGEAKSKQVAAQLTHRILMEWVPRQILIWMVRQGQGKGLQHGRMVRRTTLALMGDDHESEWSYMEEASINLTQMPGVQKMGIRPVPSLVKELVDAGLVKRAADIESITVTINERLDCPAAVLTFTTDQIEFLLKLAEDLDLRNSIKEKVIDALGDLDDAKAGRYELPAEVDGEAAAEQVG